MKENKPRELLPDIRANQMKQLERLEHLSDVVEKFEFAWGKDRVLKEADKQPDDGTIIDEIYWNFNLIDEEFEELTRRLRTLQTKYLGSEPND